MPNCRKRQDTKLLDIEKLLEQLDSADIYEDDDGNKIQTVYLSDIRSITPSGKVYTPWANSNVDVCPRCKGLGSIKNKHGKKHNFMRAFKKHQILLRRINEYDSWFDAPKSLKNKMRKAYAQEEKWAAYQPCAECAGLGSLEARLDEDFWKQLEQELDTIGAWHHSNEGDGCDVMVSRVAKGKT